MTIFKFQYFWRPLNIMTTKVMIPQQPLMSMILLLSSTCIINVWLWMLWFLLFVLWKKAWTLVAVLDVVEHFF